MNPIIQTLLQSKKIQTPAYFYDVQKIKKQIDILRNNPPKNFEIYYAMKGNSNLAIIKYLQHHEFGTEIASGGEFFLAKKSGFSGDQIIYTGPSKSDDELREAVHYGLKTIHVESCNEAVRLDIICKELGKKQNILVRVNASFEVHTYSTQLSGCPSPFGISEENFFDELPKILKLENINFQGLHVYNASGILDYKLLLQNVKNVFEMVVQLEKEFPQAYCEYVDFGGGLGIDYMGIDVDLPKAELNDFLCIEKIGAYGVNAGMNNFLSHRLPVEVLVDGDEWKIIRKRGKREDLLLNVVE